MRLCARLDQSFHSLQHLITKKTWIFFRKLLAKIENVKNENRYFFCWKMEMISSVVSKCVWVRRHKEKWEAAVSFLPPHPPIPSPFRWILSTSIHQNNHTDVETSNKTWRFMIIQWKAKIKTKFWFLCFWPVYCGNNWSFPKSINFQQAAWVGEGGSS